MINFRIIYETVTDGVARDAFKAIQDFFTNLDMLKPDWRKHEFRFDSAVTNFRVPHVLNKTPTDLIQTYVSGGATVTWHFDDFTKTDLYVTTSAACTVRIMLGRFS